MKSFVFNLGFDTSHVTSVLTREGVDNGSEIVLIVPSFEEDRQENAVREIQDFVSSLDVDAEVKVFQDFGTSFSEKVFSFQGMLEDLDNIVLSLSGGSRDCLIPLVVAAVTGVESVKETYFRSDIDSSLEKITLPSLPMEVDSQSKELLKYLKEPKTVQSLVEETDRSSSSIYEILNELKAKGMVESEGRPAEYQLTLSGKIFS